MREVKFRALELETAQIIFGSFIKEDGFYMENGNPVCGKPCTRYYIQDEDNIKHEIAEDTLGQCTGLKDKNGIDIYGGDIVNSKARGTSGYYKYKIVYDKVYGSYIGNVILTYGTEDANNMPLGEIRFDAEVIGNIYENQELLKKTI